jgi:hypothetical protein
MRNFQRTKNSSLSEEVTMVIRLGKNQRNVLVALHCHKRWQRGGGRVWNESLDETEHLLDQLVQKGLVAVTEEKLVDFWKREQTSASMSQFSPLAPQGKNQITAIKQ